MTEHRSTEERREQIVHAMVDALAEHGYAKATIAKIADRAGLAPGLLHYHFPNKQKMLEASLTMLAEEQRELLRAEVAEVTDPVAALAGILSRMLAPGSNAQPDRVAAWVAILAEGIRAEGVRELLAEALGSYRDLIADVLRDGKAAGRFDFGEQSAEAFAAGLVALIQGYFTVGITAREIVPSSSAFDVAMTMVRGFTVDP